MFSSFVLLPVLALCRRAKAAWEAYYEKMLPEMKEDKPGLKLMQYKSRIFEMWLVAMHKQVTPFLLIVIVSLIPLHDSFECRQRSPENPRNQPKKV